MSDAADEQFQLAEALRPPAEITRELFLTWRRARRGSGNPERMTNPVWTWLARHPDITAWAASKHFGAPTMGDGPGWTNQRFGQTQTALPDGRTLHVAGEHEDSYDPDFFIYNDVHVTAPDGALELYGYAPDAFPPTDFHTATLVGDALYLVGNLGYHTARGTHTQVLVLDTRTLAVSRLSPTGEDAGWLSKHTATLAADGASIGVTGGRAERTVGSGRARARSLVENIDDFALSLATLTWTRLTDRRWIQYEIEREQGLGDLWSISQLADYADSPDAFFQSRAAHYRAELGREPDLTAWRTRYQPPVPHSAIPRVDDEWRVHRISIEGVTVRYTDTHHGARVVIEGALPDPLLETLVSDLTAKLSRADAAPYLARRL